MNESLLGVFPSNGRLYELPILLLVSRDEGGGGNRSAVVTPSFFGALAIGGSGDLSGSKTSDDGRPEIYLLDRLGVVALFIFGVDLRPTVKV